MIVTGNRIVRRVLYQGNVDLFRLDREHANQGGRGKDRFLDCLAPITEPHKVREIIS